MSATQFDFNPGLDLSSLTSATLAQLIQTIAQISPVANIGGVIFQPGTSQDSTIEQGTGGSPSVDDNPRFERYIWINTFAMPPIPYFYDSDTEDWTSVTVPASSVGPTQLAAHSAILDHFFNATAADGAAANKILRYDSAGDLIEAVTLATILSANSVPLTALDKSGAGDYNVLQYRASDALISLRALTGAAFATGGIGLDKLATATDGFIMKMAGGVWSGVDPGELLPTDSVFLDRLSNDNDAGGAPSAYQVAQRNSANTATLWTTPIFSREQTVDDVAVLGTTARQPTFVFGFNVKIFRVTLRCTTADLTYAVGDEIDFAYVTDHDGSDVENSKGAAFIDPDSPTTVRINYIAQSTNTNIASNANPPIVGALTGANWTLRVRAWG